MARSPTCPSCGTVIAMEGVQRSGILHCREERLGGPFYTFVCEGCGHRLAAERNAAGGYRLSDEDALRDRPRVLRALRNFLAAPPKPRRASRRGTPLKEAQRSEPPKRDPPTRARPKEVKPATPPPKPPSVRWTASETELLRSLGLSSTLDPNSLKRHYRAFVRAEHPDRYVTAPADERKRREAEFVRSKEAYRRLLARFER